MNANTGIPLDLDGLAFSFLSFPIAAAGENAEEILNLGSTDLW
jgi:hypothetical protein